MKNDLAAAFPLVYRLPAASDLHAETTAGLFAPHAHISQGWFYDAQGCALYEAITELDEYYPTRTERAIFDANASTIAQACGAGGQFIDLGSGDSKKAGALLPRLKSASYLAVDIAESAIMDALPRIAKIAPQVSLTGLVTDFSSSLALDGLLEQAQRLFFYPGSSIGNYSPIAAASFLRRVRSHCRAGKDALLIGVDSVKEKDRLDAAYDDALGVTAAFNRNALRHLNRALGSNFELRDWQHRGFFNPEASRIEMHLEALSAVQLRIGNQQRRFAIGERIHTENSYKYEKAIFANLLTESGFSIAHYFTDAAQDFHVFYAVAID